MKAVGVFLSGLLLLGIFNFIYTTQNPIAVNTMTIGAITGMITTVIAVGVISGISILGSGLNSESIKIIFGIGTLLNMLFQIEISGFPIGLGLINSLFSVFSNSDAWGVGLFIATLISVLILASGLIIIIGGTNQ